MERQTFIVLHILAIVTIIGSMLTGFRISLVSQDWLAAISVLLPQGAIHTWHLGFAVGLTLLVIAYTGYSLRAPFRSYPSIYHKIINYLGYISICLIVLSGWAVWANFHSHYARSIHQVAMWLMVSYFVLHAWIYILQKGRGVFGAILPKRLKLMHGAITLCLVILGLFIHTFTVNTSHQLEVQTMADTVFIEIDGKATEAQWQSAPTYTVTTIGGANFDNGSTEVSIKALANQYETYFLISWQDKSKSTNHLPLLKTDNGWQVQENGFYRFDERTFYEDKFAVMLSDGCEIAGDNTYHSGSKPIKNKPKNWHGKGYHASLDGKVRDLWHWKAVRTNDMYLADDNFIGPPSEHLKGKRRYSAGYQADGKESGAYVMNWQWYSNQGVSPKRLPMDPQSHQAVLPWFGSKPYQHQQDTYPIGTLLPSVLYRSNRFEGDRADVRARGEWHDGRWTLELVRKHNTRSKYDIPLQTGTCMWVSAFDHAQIAHTRHIKAIKLRYAL
ncbi:hypothetical protein N473_07675 [Pseudoalteromonas luteoviolacea CPMOR-1]|uniref:Cytochrome c-552/DMSO reductase-like haem-binding domain-containing protein n=1 Tax=Pseudoalteromonas luteoviolacea CPMOR-1 TaxID=1365248 RepID=A0A167NHP1_9GAMM|nr:ethylbenzene dehydrogenase-related protein [Pseudoalteromonas luteoviolacea]KZN68296.1 hypothetical protein N473_07675 [Pseudoalteromonas luteoviolacea CPMOR-1]